MSTQQEKKEQPRTDKITTDEDARDLIQSVIYDLQDHKPEALVKVFAILREDTKDSGTHDSLLLLMNACFEQSDAHDDAFNQYAKACRANPTTWNLAEANPRRAQQDLAASTSAESLADKQRKEQD